MAAGGSTRVVVVALIGNFLIAVTKFAAAFVTGASAMLAEGVHSLVDTGNQALLLFGMRRARRPADAEHPFGYGKELYFWSFVVAMLLFSAGAGVSLWEGVRKLSEPHPVENPLVAFVVLGLAMIFEGYALRAALRELNAQRRGEPVFCYVRRSKDSALVTVVFEDAAAMAGLVVAFVMLALAEVLGMPSLDAWASILIGCLLAAAAIFLLVETKSLLIGEAADAALVRDIRALAARDGRIRAVNEILTLHFGPHEVLATLSLDFVDHIGAGEVEGAVSALEHAIKSKRPEVRRVFVEAQGARGHRRAAAQIE